MNKGVFLDRDGTVIRDIVYLNDPSKIEILEGSYEAIRQLNAAGFLVFLVTNQSGVARGLVTEEMVRHINDLLVTDFKKNGAVITDCAYCPHPVDGGCECRKPNPGMLKSLAKKHGVDLNISWMVGDRITDAVAGDRAGTRSILLQNETTPPIDPGFSAPKYISRNMLEVAKQILGASQEKK